LLDLRDLHCLTTHKHLFLHLLKFLQKLLLLRLGLLLLTLLLLELLNEALLILSLQIGLLLNLFALLISSSLDLFLLFGEALLKFTHLLGVFDNLSPYLLATLHNTMHLHDLIWGCTRVERVQLLFELSDLFLVFTEQSIFRILVNSWFVLDILRTTSIPQCVHSLVEIKISGADIGNHHGLCVTS